MSASKGLAGILQSLLETGITIDDGKEKIIITAARSTGRRSARGNLLFTVKSAPSARGGQSRVATGLPATAFTPTGKVSSRKLYSIIEHFQEGISKANLAKRGGIARRKLSLALQRLVSKGLVTERGGRFYPAAAGQSFRSSRRRQHAGCSVGGCHAPHYAKGLCNNHYNSHRRQSARELISNEDRRANGSFKEAILSHLRHETRQVSLYELAASLKEKWQSLRKDIQELVAENKVAKDGKLYTLVG